MTADHAPSLLIRELRQGTSRVVDLSVLISPDRPCTWPSGPPFQAFVKRKYEDVDDPDYVRVVVTDEHLGTHVDAPAHYVAEVVSAPYGPERGWLTSDTIPLEALIGPAAVVDVSDLVGNAAPGCSPEITPQRILAWEQEHGRLARGEVLLLRSGWSDRYAPGSAGSRYGWDSVVLKAEPCWPGLTEDAIDLVIERGVSVIGTDGGGPGVFQRDPGTHQRILSVGIPIIERLAHLDLLPPRGAVFWFLPVHWEGGSGAPGRAIALLPVS